MRKKMSDFSLSDFQEANRLIYEIKNDRGYDISAMVSQMLGHAGRILKFVRKGEIQKIGQDLCMAFSWSLGLANKLHLDLGKETTWRFPGVCAYCHGSPCFCGNNRQAKRKPLKHHPRISQVCKDLQKMFARIYPQTLEKAASHLTEEVIEVSEAVQHFVEDRKNQQKFEEIRLELVDVITTIFAVATNSHLDLAEQMRKYFSRGCPGCHRSPCRCT